MGKLISPIRMSVFYQKPLFFSNSSWSREINVSGEVTGNSTIWPESRRPRGGRRPLYLRSAHQFDL